MSLEFLRPWALAVMAAGLGWTIFIALRSRRTRGLALALRCLLVCLLSLAVAAPSILLPGGNSAVWLLADASDSARAMQEQITGDIRTAIENKNKSLDAGVIAFGGNAMVEAPLSAEPMYSGVRTAVDGQDSDLSGALTLAGALLPSDAGGRIVVLSDGMLDDPAAAAKALAARGIPVDVLPISAETLPDAQVSEVRVPASAYAGQSFSVTVRVDAALDTAGTLVLYQNRMPVDTRQVTLRKGENTFVFRDVAQVSGVVTYEARLLAAGDARSQNDSLGAYVYVQGAPRLLLVEGRPGEGSEMAAMLRASGMDFETIQPVQLPADAGQLQRYDAVVLVNVDYDAADESQWQALDTAVKTLGRGLTVIGGDSSYALGGYRGTLLEDMLPVTIDVRSKLDLPSLALMLVIDKSGSMTDGMFGTTRLELAKEAAMRACEVLTENDQVGVIAFDDAAKWVVPLRQADDIAAIQNQIGTIRPGGGTAFYTALYESARALIESDAAQKHVIFLTDGEPGDSGYEGIVEDMAAHGITLTTVAVGSGADQRLLRALAQRGGGRAYAADEFDNLPKIFTKETYLVSGSYVQNRTFTPIITHESVLTDFAGFPQMTGYLAATEKALSTVELISDREDPILAWWQYGAGRVLCFMGDSRGAWTGQLLSWSDAAAFYGGMAAFVLPGDERSGELTAQRAGDSLEITYTAPEDGSGLSTRVTAILPDGSRQEILLAETAQGVYTGQMTADQYGAYALRVEQYAADGSLERVMEGGTVAGYAREYDLRRTQETGVLERLAALTGGQVYSDASQLLAQAGKGASRRVDLTRGLMIAALLLLLLDIAVRRLGWDALLDKWLKREPRKGEKQRMQKPAAPEKAAAPKPPVPQAGDTARALLQKQKDKKLL
ncbi:MAG: VWA domain-containing protein [Clostridia bacterium]|nr:VWA domain-containing protein [Clostridia bacterium]